MVAQLTGSPPILAKGRRLNPAPLSMGFWLVRSFTGMALPGEVSSAHSGLSVKLASEATEGIPPCVSVLERANVEQGMEREATVEVPLSLGERVNEAAVPSVELRQVFVEFQAKLWVIEVAKQGVGAMEERRCLSDYHVTVGSF